MYLYQYGGDSKKLIHSYRIETLDNGRLHTGYIDHVAINALGKLIGGELTCFEDISAAEMALKSLIFHENTIVQRPSIKVEIVDKTSETFHINQAPNLEHEEAFSVLYEKQIIQHHIGGIQQLIGFVDKSTALQHIKYREQKALEEERLRKKNGLPRSTLNLFSDSTSLEYVADSYDDFFKKIFLNDENLIGSYINPMIQSGSALYLGDTTVSKILNTIATQNADQFFNVAEKEWHDYLDILKRRIEIPVPLFLSVVLNRANSRIDIPKVILELRDEFLDARRQLWTMFDEADHLLSDTRQSIKLLNSIENDTKQALRKITKQSDQLNASIRCDSLGRAISLLKIAGYISCAKYGNLIVDSLILTCALEDVFNYLNRLKFNQGFRVDASHLLVKNLQNVELKGLLKKHLSDRELNNITNTLINS
ncbi:hypothetical protein BCS42_04055 [Crenothrix sp. D3]|nr:hypothetical protein BCS42_04055 [Crenothrix sp. D3]